MCEMVAILSWPQCVKKLNDVLVSIRVADALVLERPAISIHNTDVVSIISKQFNWLWPNDGIYRIEIGQHCFR